MINYNKFSIITNSPSAVEHLLRDSFKKGAIL